MASPLLSPLDTRFTLAVTLRQLQERLSDVYTLVSQIDEASEIHDYSCNLQPKITPQPPDQTAPQLPPNGIDVEELAGLGIKGWEIALMLSASAETVEKQFSRELQLGPVKSKIELFRSIHKNAVTCKNASLTIFWAKTRFNAGGETREQTVWDVLDCFEPEESPKS